MLACIFQDRWFEDEQIRQHGVDMTAEAAKREEA